MEEDRPPVEIELDVPGASRYAAELEQSRLSIGGLTLEVGAAVDVVFLAGEEAFSVPARVAVADDAGVGLELTLADVVRSRLVALAEAAPEEAPEEAPEVEDLELEEPSEGRTAPPKNVFQRLRGLTLVQQHKVAREGELHERIALERIYGKTVWEPLLRNPRITTHEVARISRMGNLPRPQLELIVGNATWLGVPEIRRALLGNPRLTADMIPRVLRLLSKQELKVATNQVAYPALVREAARRLLRDQGLVPR